MGSLLEDIPVRRGGEHPCVEVACRATGDSRVVTGVEEIRPPLEGLHHVSATAQRCDDCEGNGSLAYSAGGAGNQKTCHGRPPQTEPLRGSGRPATIRSTVSATSATRWLISPTRSRKRRPSAYAGTTPLPTSVHTRMTLQRVVFSAA